MMLYYNNRLTDIITIVFDSLMYTHACTTIGIWSDSPNQYDIANLAHPSVLPPQNHRAAKTAVPLVAHAHCGLVSFSPIDISSARFDDR